MKKQSRKLVSMLLTLVMLLSLLPTTAFAVESTPITSVKVSDVTEPVIGATPDFDITLTGDGVVFDEEEYPDSVAWYKVNMSGEFVEWVPMDGDTSFGAGLYELRVALKPEAGYDFTDATKFYYNEYELPAWHDTYDSCYDCWVGGVEIYLYFTVEESATPTEITNLSATVTEPVAGASPSFEAVAGGEGYTAELEWEIVAEETIIDPEDDYKFKAGEKYGLWVAFIPEDGYEFADDVTITINGITPEDTYEYGDEIVGLVTYTIPAATPTITSVKVSDITEPVIGATPDFDITLTGTGAVIDEYDPPYWYKYNPSNPAANKWEPVGADATFSEGDYMLEVWLVAEDGYEFTEDTECFFDENKLPDANYAAEGESCYLFDSDEYVVIYLYFTVEDAIIPINAINITGISEPIAGQLPDISGITTDTTGIFLGDIIWCTPEASVMNDRLKFEEGKTYTFCANYTVDEGYELLSGAALTHDLAGGFNAKIVPSMKFIEIKYTVSAAPTYTVSFVSDGGSGTMADVSVVYGEYTLPECTFTPPAGKQFKCWSVGGSEKAVGDKITVTADTTLTAVWEDAKILINTISVRGITAPVDRAYPVTTGITTDTPGLTITLAQWNRDIYMQTTPFVAGYTYSLSIYFEVAEGYEISDGVTVEHDLPNGVPGRKNLEAESPWISIDYTVPDPAPKTPIGSVRVSDITVPVYGATPDLAITVDVTGAVYDDGDGYDAINWYKYNPEDAGWYLMYEDTSFGAGTYILAVYLKADDGYEFTEGTKFYFGDNPLPEFDDKLESNYKYSSEAYVAIYIYYTVEAPETPATYTVSFDANGGSVTPASAVTGADGKLTSLPTPARSGSYSFKGWYTAASGGTKVTTATVFTADTTIYAQWTYTGGGGGGGSYAPVSYAITVVDAKNGDVTADTKSAAKGETVTVTVDPDKGYTLETLTVIDKNGKEIELTNKGDGKYTFKMPASKVTVKATFMDDNTMLNFFVDVPADSYYYDAVLWAVKEGITNGTSATTFSPDASCTRAQMVTFLWRAAGSPEPKVTECKFTDVNMDSYYGKAVLWAVENGITNGTSDTTFSPDATCTRAQMAAFLCRMADGKPVSSTNAFTDVKADAYYADSVQWAVENAITNGTGDNKFSPDATCTRAQMVTFLYRYFVK